MVKQDDALLAGYRVLDLTDEKGLLCGKILGELGADVIKIEMPGGDAARNMGPFYKDMPHPDKSLFWFYTNLNKRGITLNIETGEGREIFKKLCLTAHIIIESFEPGYLESLGIGYEEIEKINNSLVFTSITPYGQKGPCSKYKATDITGCATGGMVRIFGNPGEAPYRLGLPQFYFLGSLHAASGTVMALYHSEFTNEGQWVDVSCQEAAALSLMDVSSWWDLNRVNIKGTGGYIHSHRPDPPGDLFVKRIWECKDGYVVFIFAGGASPGMVASTTAIVKLANENKMALDIKDYDWSSWDATSATQQEADMLMSSISEFIKSKTKVELFEEAAKRSILLAPINHIGEISQSAQLNERGFLFDVDHPELGETITYPGFPVKMSDIGGLSQKRAPLTGEHNEEVYISELGFTREDLVLLKTQAII